MMVDLAEIQAIYYMVAATGVLVAAVFYILNMRETTRNRRLTLTNNLMQNFTSEEGSRRWLELMTMEWKDFDDFRAKYDSSLNPRFGIVPLSPTLPYPQNITSVSMNE